MSAAMTEKYMAEYEKYRGVIITEGVYALKENPAILYEIVDIGPATATVKTVSSGKSRSRTLHWCRKNLVKK